MQTGFQKQPMFQSFMSKHPKFGSLAWTPQDAQQLKEDLQNKRVLFWDVDTQVGFMDPIRIVKTSNGGTKRVGLPVPGAGGIKPNLKILTNLHAQHKIPRIATMDSHDPQDPEFASFKAISDEHCVNRNPIDWKKIPETTTTGEIKYVAASPKRNDLPNTFKLKSLFEKGRTVVLEKNTYSVFQHRVGATPETAKFNENTKANLLIERLKSLGLKTAIVYGVATDFCVKLAVDGLKQAGIRPIVVNDAIKGVYTNDLDSPTPQDPNANPFVRDLQKQVYDTYRDVTTVSTQTLENAIQEALTSQ